MAKADKGGDRTKVTLRLPDALVQQAKHRAVDERRDLQDIVADALRAYLARTAGGR